MVRAIALVRDYLLRTHDSFFHINFASSCLLCWFLIYSPRIKGCQLPTVYSIWSRVFWAELALINCISITFLSLKLCINLLVKLLTTLLPDLHGSSIYVHLHIWYIGFRNIYKKCCDMLCQKDCYFDNYYLCMYNFLSVSNLSETKQPKLGAIFCELVLTLFLEAREGVESWKDHLFFHCVFRNCTDAQVRQFACKDSSSNGSLW